MDSLIAAKGELRVALLAGQIVNCPCCKQRCKIYKRKLNANMALFLCSLVALSGAEREWVHYRNIRFTSRDYSYLKHWGLVEECDPGDTTKRTSGIWRPTPQGIAFARGEIEVISHVHLYNNVAYDVGHTERIGIIDALGDKFDYQELMRGCVGGADH